MAEAETVTYRGNCHCGNFVYETKLPEIKSAFDCNCSICTKKGYLWVFPGKGNVNIVKGSLEGLTAYQFGAKKLNHLFCPTCASTIAASQDDEESGLQFALNAHAFQGLDTWAIEKTPYEGASLGDPWQPPSHKGESPKAEGEDLVYTGSCHCGAFTVAATSKPLDETFDGPIVCNCSSCERNAALWVYSPKESVILSGDEANMGRYKFNTRMVDKVFCKTCGVVLLNQFNDLSEEEIAALPERMRLFRDRQHAFTGFNARVLHGVDISKFKTKKVDGANNIPGEYVNP
ncbi:Mss4-like protein [Trichoderma chlorosporum]